MVTNGIYQPATSGADSRRTSRFIFLSLIFLQHPGSGILCILSRTLLPVFPTGKESRSGPGWVGFCAATPRQVDGSQRPSGVVRQEENVVAVVSPCDCLYGLLKQAVILADLFKQFGQQR